MKNFYPIKFNTWFTIIFCNVFLIINNAKAQKIGIPIFTTAVAKTKLNNDTTLSLLSKKFKSFSVVSFPAIEISRFLQSNVISNKAFQLKTPTDLFELQLSPSNIVSKNFKLTIQDPSGLIETYPSTENIFYKGFANNNPDNIVRLTVKEGLISGFIQNGGKEIFIESLSNYIKNANPGDVIIYNTIDIISTENTSCGVTDRADFINKAQSQKKLETPRENLVGDCKKLKILFLTDYSMYSFFNGDMLEMQNKMLATLNNAQGVYTKLNFGTDSTTDIGEDELNFEMVGFHISTCSKCDVILDNEVLLQGSSLVTVRKWIRANADTTSPIVSYYWTRKQLYVSDNTSSIPVAGVTVEQFSNCNPIRWPLIGCNYRPEDGYLRQVTAHELGHTFGCYHDNAVSPSVTSYIMNASINPLVSKLSTLADFPGVILFGSPYSSKLIVRNMVKKLAPCLLPCDTLVCNPILNLKAVNIAGSDSILLTWQGNSLSYKIKIREKTSLNNPYLISKITSEKNIVLKGLQRCSYYTAEVINECNEKTLITFFTSSIEIITPKVVHQRADLYDLEVRVGDAVNFLQDSLRITVDHVTKYFKPTTLPEVIILKDCFSDGARHRIDVYQGVGNKCRTTVFYKAPYYRSDAIKLANADFENCAKPIDWKDSILRYDSTFFNTYTPFFSYKKIYSSFTSPIIVDGTIDSTCMMYFSNNDFNRDKCTGSISLTSPTITLENFRNKYLSFDYKQNIRPVPVKQAFFKVDAYNGQQWVTIFNAPTTRPITLFDPLNPSTFWDTMPARKFISLDNFSNKDFRVRFVIEDSITFTTPPTSNTFMFLALDNIKIDAYNINLKPNNISLNILPNPTQNELFIKTDLQTEQPDSYSIIDATGKLIESKKLINYRINVEKLSSALYFIQIFFKGGTRIGSYKFIKQ